MEATGWFLNLLFGVAASLIAALLIYMARRTRPLFASRFPRMLGQWEVTTEINLLPDEKMHITQQYWDRFSGYLAGTDIRTKRHYTWEFHARFVTDDVFCYRFRPRAARGEARFIDDGVGMIRIDHSRVRGEGVTVWVGIYTEESIRSMGVSITKASAEAPPIAR